MSTRSLRNRTADDTRPRRISCGLRSACLVAFCLPGTVTAADTIWSGSIGITSDYMDWLLPVDPERRAAAVDLLFGHLARHWTWLTLELQGLRADTALFPHVNRAHGPRFLVERRTGPKTLAIQLEGSWDAYLRSRHHGLRKKLRSRPRQLQLWRQRPRSWRPGHTAGGEPGPGTRQEFRLAWDFPERGVARADFRALSSGGLPAGSASAKIS